MKEKNDILCKNKMLQSMIEEFYNNKNMQSYMKVCELLRNTTVYIPTSLTVNDQCINDIFDKSFENSADNDVKINYIYSDNNERFFPVFTNKELISNSKHSIEDCISKMFIDVIDWVDFFDLDGIIVDAFNNVFVVEKSMFNIIRDMKV